MSKLTINVEGVKLTPEIIDLLKDWQGEDPINKSMPEELIGELTDIQDFLCRMLLDGRASADDTKFLFATIIFLKDTLRTFIPNREKEDAR